MTTTWRLPLFDLRFGPEERFEVDRLLASGWLTMGPRTAAFEEAMARALDVPHAFMVTSATTAFYLALLAMELDPARPVIVPAITFVATANVPILRGHRVLLADIESVERPVLSAAHCDALLREHPDAIVMPVHYAGYEADVWDVLRRHPRCAVIEDAAHAAGARDHAGRPLGGCHTSVELGAARTVGCFSFFSNKNLSTGEGGLIVTHDPVVAERIRLQRSHGMTRLTWERHAMERRDGAVGAEGEPLDPITGRPLAYDVLTPGTNLRPTEIAAAIGLVRLQRLDAENARRRELIARYRAALAPLGIAFPFAAADDARSSVHLAAALFPDAPTAERSRAALHRERIQTSHHYTPLHRFRWFRETFGPLSLPNAEAFASRELTLPLYPEMSDADVDLVAEVLRGARA